MPLYVDGFVLPLPRKNLAAYRRMAQKGCNVWMRNGALEYCECVGDDLFIKGVASFAKELKVKPSETVVFAWITYKSRAHRDKVNAAVMKDPSMGSVPTTMPFDMNRMLYGGFKMLVKK